MQHTNNPTHGKVLSRFIHNKRSGLIPTTVFLSVSLLLLLLSLPACPFFPLHSVLEVEAKGKKITLVLDPGHGGSQSGAEKGDVKEKHLNLTIAKYLKEILETDYKGVQVSLTRDEDDDIGLKERVEIASDREADMLISLHNNARGDNFEYKDGCTVLTAQGNYKPDLARQEQELACCILSELEKLGLNNRGILLRDSETGDTYEDGSVADYYAIVRTGLNMDLPSVIVEHAFMDEENDFENHLSSDEQLKELAQADAAGIARYFGLKSRETGDILPPPANYEVTFFHMYDENPDHNKKSTQVFYPTEEKEDDPAGKNKDKDPEESTDENSADKEGKHKDKQSGKSDENEDRDSETQSHINFSDLAEHLRMLGIEISRLFR